MAQTRLAIDFDGTIVKNRFPKIGPPVPYAFESLKKFKDLGAILILWTMRSDGQEHGDVLSEAVEFCRQHGLEFDAINIGVSDREWTTSPKVHADIYIDDRALGCPTILGYDYEECYVDWQRLCPWVCTQIRERQSGNAE